MSRDSHSGLSTWDSGLIPDWCAWGRGESALLFVAPHGGRRPPFDAAAPPPHLRVNDLYTPEVTRTLADALHAGFVTNHGMDRNALDLNRISQVRRRAAWFLELLVQEIDGIIARQGCAEIVFVHGWNTGQPKCDIGIGAVETAAGLHLSDGAQLTVSEAYLRGRIGALRSACAQALIRAPIGERYPGSHRNNLLQLFTARASQIDDPCAQRIAAWVAAERVNALQLELGIPLRWPGIWQERFVGAVVSAFGDSRKSKVKSRKPEHQSEERGDAFASDISSPHLTSPGETVDFLQTSPLRRGSGQASRRRHKDGGSSGRTVGLSISKNISARPEEAPSLRGRLEGPSRHLSTVSGGRGTHHRKELRTQNSELRTNFSALQFYDPATDVGMFAGVGRLGPRAVAGRLLLFLGGQRVALFTGEEANPRGDGVEPLKFSRDDDLMHVEFSGPMLRLEDAALYTDLEAALAASQLIEGTVQLHFRQTASSPAAPAQFGTVSGRVAIAGRTVEVHAGGFANAGAFRGAGANRQTMIAAAFGTERAVLLRLVEGERGGAVHFAGGAAQPLPGTQITVCTDGDVYTPATFELTCAAQLPLYGQAVSRMGILRPAGNGGYLRVTFGVARFRWGDQEGYGLYEHARPVPLP